MHHKHGMNSLNALLMLLLCMCMCKYTTFACLVWNFPNYSSNKLFPKTKVVGFGELSNFHVDGFSSFCIKFEKKNFVCEFE